MLPSHFTPAEAGAWPLLFKDAGLCKQSNYAKKQQYCHFSIMNSKQAV